MRVDTVADPLICSLLNEDFILRKVLTCLRRDGLHECRRVCTRWEEICNELEVYLSVTNANALHCASEKYPHAAELRFRLPTTFAENEIDEDAMELSDEDFGGAQDVFADAALEKLATFQSLRRLQLRLIKEETTPEVWTECFHRLSGLRELCLSFHTHREDFPNVQSCLNSLTGLTGLASLEILSTYWTGATMPRMNGFTALHTLIANLEFFFDTTGAFAFPDSTQLVTFCAFRCKDGRQRRFASVLQAALPFAPTLRSLAIDASQSLEWTRSSCELLPMFGRLERLAISAPPKLMNDVLARTRTLLHIKELTLESGFSKGTHVLNRLTNFSKLEKLSLFSDEPVYENAGRFISSLQNLTMLSVPDINVGSSLRFLTSLTSLYLGCLHEHDEKWEVEILASLSGLSRLEELTFDCHHVATSYLTNLTHLKELRVHCCEFDAEFMPFLAELTQLTHLLFVSRMGEITERDLCNLRKMKRLSSLTLEENCHNPLYLLLAEGQLKRLRYLNLQNFQLTASKYWEFFNKFPSLRRLISR